MAPGFDSVRSSHVVNDIAMGTSRAMLLVARRDDGSIVFWTFPRLHALHASFGISA